MPGNRACVEPALAPVLFANAAVRYVIEVSVLMRRVLSILIASRFHAGH